MWKDAKNGPNAADNMWKPAETQKKTKKKRKKTPDQIACRAGDEVWCSLFVFIRLLAVQKIGCRVEQEETYRKLA